MNCRKKITIGSLLKWRLESNFGGLKMLKDCRTSTKPMCSEVCVCYSVLKSSTNPWWVIRLWDCSWDCKLTTFHINCCSCGIREKICSFHTANQPVVDFRLTEHKKNSLSVIDKNIFAQVIEIDGTSYLNINQSTKQEHVVQRPWYSSQKMGVLDSWSGSVRVCLNSSCDRGHSVVFKVHFCLSLDRVGQTRS